MFEKFMKIFDEKNMEVILSWTAWIGVIAIVFGMIYSITWLCIAWMTPIAIEISCFQIRACINKKVIKEIERTARRERYYRL